MIIDMYLPMMWLTKSAILLEWMRIFVPYPTRNYFFWTCHAIIWIHAAMFVAAEVASNLGCTPLEKHWDVWLPGTCIEWQPLHIAVMAFNLIDDVVILLLPQPVIWKLQLTRKQKLGVSAIFSIGLVYVPFSALASMTSSWLDTLT
jgi:hypothetical protein